MDAGLGQRRDGAVFQNAKEYPPSDGAKFRSTGCVEHPPKGLQRRDVFLLRVVVTVVPMDGDPPT